VISSTKSVENIQSTCTNCTTRYDVPCITGISLTSTVDCGSIDLALIISQLVQDTGADITDHSMCSAVTCWFYVHMRSWHIPHIFHVYLYFIH